MKRALVLGLGLSGLAAQAFLTKRGVEVLAHDDGREGNPPLPPWDTIDALVPSPGISPDHPLMKAARNANVPVIGEMELACRALRGPAVGITGTNGKTTVTLLTAAILQEAGLAARPLGNVGVPLTTVVDELDEEEIAVLELSSYQLETMTSRVLDAAVLLNIAPDHLDRYKNLDDYLAAKLRIAKLCKGPFYREGDLPEAPLPPGIAGIHADNARAAWALASQFDVSPDHFHKALAKFQCPPHRMEVIARKGGITYINDSKATNVAATARAVESLQGPVALIAGGRDKHGSYEPWRAAFAGKVTIICLIGEAAQRIERELDEAFAMKHCATLQEAVDCAQRHLEGEGILLLSPGCSSFDMFENFEARGSAFRTIVGEP